MEINIIACIAEDGGIGYNNKLLFHIKEDMERFKSLTTGHTIIMGRKTFESLPHGALPNRRNIVISHQDLTLKGCEVYHSLEDALAHCRITEKVFVIGGESIYRQAMELTDTIYLTEVKAIRKADTFFPHISPKKWSKCFIERHKSTEEVSNLTYFYEFSILHKN